MRGALKWDLATGEIALFKGQPQENAVRLRLQMNDQFQFIPAQNPGKHVGDKQWKQGKIMRVYKWDYGFIKSRPGTNESIYFQVREKVSFYTELGEK